MLLQTAKQSRRPVYVMLTMRTDFLGDCDVFEGLPQAINQSQYLTPRFTLTQLAEAIERPLQQPPFSGSVAPGLVQRILNDVGTNRDELPIVQHALFRTWQKSRELRPGNATELRLEDYDLVGGLKSALSRHADEALQEFRLLGQETLVEGVFRGLCTRGADGQDIRRPATIQQLAEESGYSIAEVTSVVEAFRRSDRCFLMPPSNRELAPETKIDISHEALIRQWHELAEWLKAEENSARLYRRLASSAYLKRDGSGGLLKDPELAFLARWWKERQPNAAWAERYEPGAFDLTRTFLRESETADVEEKRQEAERRGRELHLARQVAEEQRVRAEQQAEAANRLAASQRRFKHAFWAAAGVAAVAVVFFLWAWNAERAAQNARTTAEEQTAVNEERLSVDRVGRAYDTLRLTYDAEAAKSMVTSERGAVESKYLGWEWNFVQAGWGASFKPLVDQYTHEGGITAVAINEDGERIATAGYESKSKETRADNPRPSMPTPSKGAREEDRRPTIKIWRFTDGKLEWEHTLPGKHTVAVTTLTFARNGELASGDASGKLFLWNRNFTEVDRRLSCPGPIQRIAFCRSDKLIAVAHKNKGLGFYDVATGNPVSQREGPDINAFSVSPDRTWLAVADGDAVVLWDTSAVPISQPRVPIGGQVRDLVFHPSGRWLGVALSHGQIKGLPVPFPGRASQTQTSSSYGLPLGVPVELQTLPPTNDHHRIAFDRRGEVLFSMGDKGVIACFDIRDLADFDNGIQNPPSNRDRLLGMIPKWRQRHLDLLTAGDSDHLVTTGLDGKIQVWHPTRQFPCGIVVDSLEGSDDGRVAWSEAQLDISADGSRIVVFRDWSEPQLDISADGSRTIVFRDERIQCWDTLTGRKLTDVSLPPNAAGTVPRVRFWGDGSQLVIASATGVATLGIANGTGDEAEFGPLFHLDAAPICLAVAPAMCPSNLAVGVPGKVVLWSQADGKKDDLPLPENEIPSFLAFDAEGKTLLAVTRRSSASNQGDLQAADTLYLFDAFRCRALHSVAVPFSVESIAFAPAGDCFFTTLRDGEDAWNLVPWEVQDGTTIVEAKEKSFYFRRMTSLPAGLVVLQPFPAVAFAKGSAKTPAKPDVGQRPLRVLGSDGSMLKLWNGKTGVDVLTIPPREGTDGFAEVIALAASADGTLVASLHSNGVLNTWESVHDLDREGFEQACQTADEQLLSHLRFEDTERAIRNDAQLSLSEKQWAIRLLRNRTAVSGADPTSRLHNQLRQLLSRPGLPAKTYEWALTKVNQLAEAGSQKPDPHFEVTRGIAQYRMTKTEDAIKTLKPLCQHENEAVRLPASAFLAMALAAHKGSEDASDVAKLLADCHNLLSRSPFVVAPTVLDAWDEARNGLARIQIQDVVVHDNDGTRTVDFTLELTSELPSVWRHLQVDVLFNGKTLDFDVAVVDDESIDTDSAKGFHRKRFTWDGVPVSSERPDFDIVARLRFGDHQLDEVAWTSESKTYALLCGVAAPSPSSGWRASPLAGPPTDVRNMRSVLLDGSGWQEVLLDQACSHDRVFSIIRRLPHDSILRPDDLFVFHFSGHGGQILGSNEKQQLALLLHDRAVPWEELRELFSTMPCQVLVLLDCAHSGAAVSLEAETSDGKKSANLHVLTSCAADQKGIDTGDGGSFTTILVRGLRGAADADSDGVVTLSELADYVRQNSDGRQQPQFWSKRTQPLPVRQLDLDPGDLVRAIEAQARSVQPLVQRMRELGPAVRRVGKELSARSKELGLSPAQIRFIQEHISFSSRIMRTLDIEEQEADPSAPASPETPAGTPPNVESFLKDAVALVNVCGEFEVTEAKLRIHGKKLVEHPFQDEAAAAFSLDVTAIADRIDEWARAWNPLPSTTWPSDSSEAAPTEGR
ncbi:MAG: caspase family protein [Pirellulaceae bacterium]|nr:caspase family protein [Pirellulaceae bacterium]